MANEDGSDGVDSVLKKPYTVFGNEVPSSIAPGPDVEEIVFEKEGCLSIVTRKVKRVVRNITIEPVMFFLSFVGSMDYVSQGQLVIDKSCNIDFDFANDTCDPGVLLDGNHTEENTAVQNEIAQFKVYESIVSHLFPILVSFFLGTIPV